MWVLREKPQPESEAWGSHCETFAREMTPPGRQCQGDLSVWIVIQWGGFACGKNLAP